MTFKLCGELELELELELEQEDRKSDKLTNNGSSLVQNLRIYFMRSIDLKYLVGCTP